MDCCGRGGGRYDIVDRAALAALWGRLRDTLESYVPARRAYRRLSLRALTTRLDVDYATAYTQARPNYARRRSQMRPETGRKIRVGIRTAVRTARRRHGTLTARELDQELESLWQKAVRRGFWVPGDTSALPSLPAIVKGRRPPLDGDPRWWLFATAYRDVVRLPGHSEDKPTGLGKPLVEVRLGVRLGFERSPHRGWTAVLVGRMTDQEQEDYRGAALAALNSAFEDDHPDRMLRLELWTSMLEQL